MASLDQTISKFLYNEAKDQAEAKLSKVIDLVVKKTIEALSDEDRPEVKWFNIVRDLTAGNIKKVFGNLDSKKEQELFKRVFKGSAKKLSSTYKFIKPDLIKEGYGEASSSKGKMKQETKLPRGLNYDVEEDEGVKWIELRHNNKLIAQLTKKNLQMMLDELK